MSFSPIPTIPNASAMLAGVISMLSDPEGAKKLVAQIKVEQDKLESIRAEIDARSAALDKRASDVEQRANALDDREKALGTVKAATEKSLAAKVAADGRMVELDSAKRAFAAEQKAAFHALADDTAEAGKVAADAAARIAAAAAAEKAAKERAAALDDREKAVVTAEADLAARMSKLKALVS